MLQHSFNVLATLIYVEKWLTWADARAHCQGLGRDLVSIHSQQDQDQVGALIDSNGGSDTRHWIGLTDQATERTFVWADGTSGSFENWYPGEPGAGEARDCVFLHKTGLLYRWFDYPCTYHARFLCSV